MKKFLSLVLVLALVMTMSLVTISAGAKDFTDDSSIKYQEAVDVMSAVKVIDGYTDGSFQPTNNLTRGAAAKIICNLILGPTTAAALSASTAPYSDVPTSNVFAGYIAFCQKEGIINGYADGTFKPTAPLTGYAFMKMLLGALGYDSAKEGYTGANWSVNVARRAIENGLTDGNDDFVGTELATREEACLYAVNTIKATLVEYETKGTEITINGATIATGASTPKVVTSGVASQATSINSDVYTGSVSGASGTNYYTVEFGEKYMPKLSLKGDNDPFMRPSHVWNYKGVEIGEYTNEADLTYTKKVTSETIYKDLGLTERVSADLYEDGAQLADFVVRDKDDDNKVGANGVLTEVFKSGHWDSGKWVTDVTITEVNTYVGQINRTVAATDKAAAYVEVFTNDTLLSAAPAGASATEKFETDDSFDDEAYVLYTFSIPEDSIQSVKAAESVTGTVSKVVNKSNDQDNSSVTVGGTEYKASANMPANLLSQVSVDMEYTAYLDEYGYVITVSEEEFGDYALVLNITKAGSGADFNSNQAKLLLADGTVKTYSLDKDYVSKGVAVNDIVSYKEKSNGTYALNEVNLTQKAVASTTFNMKNDVAAITTGTADGSSKATVYGNSKSVFVVKDVADDTFDAYTGIKTAPSVAAKDLDSNAGVDKANEKVTAYWYTKSGDVVTIMFIMPGDNRLVTDENNNMLFLAGESVSDLIHDTTGDYYEYNAYIGGELKTVKVDWKVTLNNAVQTVANSAKLNGLYSKYSVDAATGIITSLDSYTTAAATTTNTVSGYGVGSDRNSAAYTVTLGTKTATANCGTWTVADDAKFFEIDEDGVITNATYGSVTKDDDDKLYFIVDKSVVTYVFIEKVDTKNNAQPATVVVTPAGPVNATVGDTVTLTANVTVFDPKNDQIIGYQWYKDGVAIAGATGATYVVPTSAPAAQAAYTCKVTTLNEKVLGKDTAVGTSTAVQVTVNAVVETMQVTVKTYLLNAGGNIPLDESTVTIQSTGTIINAPKYANYTATEASKTVTFVAGGSATVTFLYNEKAIASVAVKTQPTKLDYKTDGSENFDATGLVVTVTYDNGTSDEVTYALANASDFVFGGTPINAGKVTAAGDVTVTYKTVASANVIAVTANAT